MNRPSCPHCGSQVVHSRGRDRDGVNRWHCQACFRWFRSSYKIGKFAADREREQDAS